MYSSVQDYNQYKMMQEQYPAPEKSQKDYGDFQRPDLDMRPKGSYEQKGIAVVNDQVPKMTKTQNALAKSYSID